MSSNNLTALTTENSIKKLSMIIENFYKRQPYLKPKPPFQLSLKAFILLTKYKIYTI